MISKLVPCACGNCNELINPIGCRGRPKRFKTGHYANRHQPSGEQAHNWRGGKFIDKINGYVMVRCRGDYVKEHRLIMEEHLGRHLTKEELVHHINGIKTDNRIENLELINRSKHSSYHHKGKKLSKKTCELISEIKKKQVAMGIYKRDPITGRFLGTKSV